MADNRPAAEQLSDQCGCKEAPWCVPHPADDAHQWASLCRLPHDHVAAEEPRVERSARHLNHRADR